MRSQRSNRSCSAGRTLALLAVSAAILLAGSGRVGPAWAGPAWVGPAWVGPGGALTGPANWPLAGAPAVLHPFDPPADRYAAGHRGVDLLGFDGASVLAAADGVVTFAGAVAGVGVVTISHGSVRTTYQPVAATVRAGARVEGGSVIGRLRTGHCRELTAPLGCLHWGLLRGAAYLDPLRLLSGGTARPTAYRLVPASERDAVRARMRVEAAQAVAAAQAMQAARATGGESGAATGLGAAAVRAARAKLGAPYVFGAAGPHAYDCSSYVQMAWLVASRGRIDIGRTTYQQTADTGLLKPVPMSQIASGDLIYIHVPGDAQGGWNHVALFIGNGQIAEEPRPPLAARIMPANEYSHYPTIARRVVG